MIFFVLRHRRLFQWLDDSKLKASLNQLTSENAIDSDPIFSGQLDEDYDSSLKGMLSAFLTIQNCILYSTVQYI